MLDGPKSPESEDDAKIPKIYHDLGNRVLFGFYFYLTQSEGQNKILSFLYCAWDARQLFQQLKADTF